MTPEKTTQMVEKLCHWHTKHQSFTILQMATLVGTLQHAATTCKWAKFLLMSLVHSVFVALKGNITTLKKHSRTFKGLLKEIERKKLTKDDVL